MKWEERYPENPVDYYSTPNDVSYRIDGGIIKERFVFTTALERLAAELHRYGIISAPEAFQLESVIRLAPDRTHKFLQELCGEFDIKVRIIHDVASYGPAIEVEGYLPVHENYRDKILNATSYKEHTGEVLDRLALKKVNTNDNETTKLKLKQEETGCKSIW